jgi:hypothetical protein
MIMVHPQYRRDPTRMNIYDIALVHAKAPFLIKAPFTARPIHLPNEPPHTKPPGDSYWPNIKNAEH